MKKKIIAAALIAVMAFSLGGCSSSQTTKVSSEIQQANPWTDYDTLEEAEEAVGFEVTLTSDDFSFDEPTYRVCKGMNLIEIQDQDGTYFRKAKDDGDISGDYNEYDFTKDITVGDITVTEKGDSENSIKVITWQNGQYVYAFGGQDGVPAATVETIVTVLQ